MALEIDSIDRFVNLGQEILSREVSNEIQLQTRSGGCSPFACLLGIGSFSELVRFDGGNGIADRRSGDIVVDGSRVEVFEPERPVKAVRSDTDEHARRLVSCVFAEGIVSQVRGDILCCFPVIFQRLTVDRFHFDDTRELIVDVPQFVVRTFLLDFGVLRRLTAELWITGRYVVPIGVGVSECVEARLNEFVFREVFRRLLDHTTIEFLLLQ
ncbi:hypothetical protein ACT4ML_18595 [Natrinema sp. LN54]|uniref:hypothetical protein n=1 Tax=Natrinema sp. LN54 TaxID=3458705 RepID=UPI004035CB05